jgi:MFS family permease
VLFRYRAVLAADGVVRLLTSAVLGRLPLGMSALAILLLVRSHTGSFAAAGVAVGAFALTGAAAAPLQGALVDRHGQPRVLLPCAAGQVVLLAALALATQAGAPVAVVVVLAALAGALVPPISACIRALWPVVVSDPAVRESAYALDAIVQEAVWTLGPLLVGFAVLTASPAVAVLLSAAITMVGTTLFATSPLSRRWRGGRHRRSRAGALASPGLRALLVSVALIGLGAGAVEVGLPALAVHAGSAGDSGVLLAIWSAGSMVGGLLYGGLTWRLSVGARYRLLLLGVALLTAPLIAARSLPVGIVLSFVAGLGYAPMLSCQYALIGRLAPPGSTAEAFTWSTAAIVGGIAAGSALAGALVGSAGVAAPFVLACSAAALAGALAIVRRQRIELVVAAG